MSNSEEKLLIKGTKDNQTDLQQSETTQYKYPDDKWFELAQQQSTQYQKLNNLEQAILILATRGHYDLNRR
jgi:hypothetical protein